MKGFRQDGCFQVCVSGGCSWFLVPLLMHSQVKNNMNFSNRILSQLQAMQKFLQTANSARSLGLYGKSHRWNGYVSHGTRCFWRCTIANLMDGIFQNETGFPSTLANLILLKLVGRYGTYGSITPFPHHNRNQRRTCWRNGLDWAINASPYCGI